MLLHLIETGRHRAWHPGMFWSAGVHGALVASVVAGAVRAGESPEVRLEREVVYLLPALPTGPRVPRDGQLAFTGQPTGVESRSGAGAPAPPRGRDRAADASLQAVRAPDVPFLIDSVVQPGTPVFVAAELDHMAERDPTSAAPEYPEAMEAQQVEGAVQAEWVVDTTGHADTTTFRIVMATHPQFVASVRAALPLMRFRPAELSGRRVQQLVRQEFSFRLHYLPDSAHTPRGSAPPQ